MGPVLLQLFNHDKGGRKIGNPLPVIKVTQNLISRIKPIAFVTRQVVVLWSLSQR